MNKNYIVALVLVVGFFIGYSYNNQSMQKNVNNLYETSKPFPENDMSYATEITCTYPQGLSASYITEITHTFNKPEKNPMIFTFSKLKDPEVGQLSYIDSTQTITTVPIVKIKDNEEELVYLDGMGQAYLATHTIYKKLGVSIYAKSVNLLGTPFGYLAMGNCIGY